MSAMFTIKRGDTFALEASAKEGAVAQNITGWTIRSHVRRGNTLIADLTVTYLDRPGGIYRLSAPLGTTGWPVGELRQDIEYTTASGQIASTETFVFECVEDVTR